MKILDTTIRDGSYAIDFKFSCRDVQDLVSKSEKIGIEYIEIGHGMGLDASSYKHGLSLHSDEEYMNAAFEVASKAKLGFFCIPGIAKLSSIENIQKLGMKFIRIGVPVCEYEKAIPYIERCKELGLEVFVNFMKSYISQPSEMATHSQDAYNRGVEAIYIVDSAGSMFVAEINEYIKAIRNTSNIQIGFHGHNNLGLAVQNTLFCIEKGVDYIDCTFQGLGRSLGNASLEQVIVALDRMGYQHNFDIPRLLEYGYAGLRNIVRDKLVNPLDYVCGYAGFHSSFLKDIYRCCSEKQVDPLRLIIAYSKINRATMDYQLLLEVADALPRDLDENPYSFGEFFSERYSDGDFEG